VSKEELLEIASHKRDQARRFRSLGRGGSGDSRAVMAQLAADLEREAVRLEAEAAETT
jgi:hypothetical protein